jgi:D-alanyl-D-alanine carboxypeptidase
LLSATAAWTATPAGAATPEALRAALQAEAEAVIGDYDLPGMTVAIVRPGSARIEAGVGLADVESGRPITSDTPMLSASIGKTFVAATVVALAEEGKLALEDPLRRWLGDEAWYPRLPNADSITLRQLLGHRSGLPDHVHEPAFAAAWQAGAASLAPRELIALVLDREPLFPAGEGFAYSDTGYLLLGLVIERVTGNAWQDVVRQRFITPLGLAHTGPSNSRNIPGLANGYVSQPNMLDLPPTTLDENGVLRWDPAVESSGGGFYSTSSDLATWGAALFSGEVLPPAAVAEMAAGGAATGSDPASRYGLGVAIIAASEWGPSYGHRGWIPGYSSSLRYFPEHGTVVAFMINTDTGIIDTARPVIREIEERLAAIVLRQL